MKINYKIIITDLSKINDNYEKGIYNYSSFYYYYIL